MTRTQKTSQYFTAKRDTCERNNDFGRNYLLKHIVPCQKPTNNENNNIFAKKKNDIKFLHSFS